MIAAAAVYVALMAVGWAPLPGHMQCGDLLYPALFVLAMRSARWEPRRLDLFLLVFVAGSALSIPGSLSLRVSGIDVAKEAYLFGAYLALAQVMSRTGALTIVRWLPASVAVTSALSLAAGVLYGLSGWFWPPLGEPMPMPYVGTVFRVAGTLDAPEFFGNLLAVAIPLAIVCRAQAADRRPWTMALAVMAIAETLTFSKALAGCVVAVTIVLWPGWRDRRFGGALRWASVAAGILLVLAFNLSVMWTIRKVDVSFGKDPSIPPPSYMYARQDAAGADSVQLRVAYNPMSYYLLKKAEWAAWQRRPIAGVGAGAFVLEAERAYQEGRLEQGYRHLAAHSTIFGRLAETGLVGLVTLAVAWFGIWLCARQAMRVSGSDGRVALACVAGFAGLFINGINVDIMHFRFLWLGLAAIRAADQRMSAVAGSASDPV